MAYSVEMPELGESVTEGTVTQWLKKVGDKVSVDEPLLEVSTDKVDTEIPSPASGVLLKIIAEEDDTVDVGAVIAEIGEEGEEPSGSDADSSSDDDSSDAAEESGSAESESGSDDSESESSDNSGSGSGSGSGSASGEAEDVTMPELGESVTEGTITQWLKSVGDKVEVDEPLLEVSTDKVDTEIPSPVAGTLVEILANEDDTVDVGAVIALLLDWNLIGVQAAALVAGLATMAFTTAISRTRTGSFNVITLVLGGVIVSALANAVLSLLKLTADPTSQLPEITYWLMGSLTGAKWSDMAFALPPIAIGLAALFALRWRINVLTMGDDEASTMGVNARRVRLIVILAATLVTAASVSISGMIGWVGLVIPHFARMIVGCDYRKLLPASMLMGASFLLIVDDVARLVASSEIPIGILTAFVGAPFFLYLITRRKQGL